MQLIAKPTIYKKDTHMNTQILMDILQEKQKANDDQPLLVIAQMADLGDYEIESVFHEIDDEDNERIIIFIE